ncbi:MAG TPA: methionyl-tRNA formyltransferase [Planctomycetota bacterium]|jgi:methionyl-tRNA formyltransferase
MRIIFCGTPEIAVPSLRRLIALGPQHEVVGIVSQPDKPQGRSKVPVSPPVVTTARELGLAADRIFQPRSINNSKTLARLRDLSPDLLCVIAYGNILRADALALPQLFPINAHASLLPKYRGASPIQAALLGGEHETGVSIMRMEAGLDSGPVLFQRAISIGPDDDTGTLHDRLAELAAECFVEAIERISAGPVTFTPQDESQSSYTPKLTKDSGKIDWTKDAAYLERFVRAMNPWPGAWTSVVAPASVPATKPLRLRVAKAAVLPDRPGVAPGSGCVLGAGEQALLVVACGGGALRISQLQPEGKRAMSAAEFLRGAGRALLAGSIWG